VLAFDARYSLIYTTEIMESKNRCIRRKERRGFKFAGRVWIEGKDGAFLGHGRVLLLERIHQYGSITEAARSMEMSYRHAWELVESINSQSKELLVEKVTGGKGGGGARLTEAGERALNIFRKFHDDFEAFLKEKADEALF
jgi:molybdate transport system regulatory protein